MFAHPLPCGRGSVGGSEPRPQGSGHRNRQKHMLECLDSFNKKQALPRMLADLAIVQACAVVSLIGTFLWQAPRLDWAETITLIRTLESYYAVRFLPLSLIFPLVFLCNGLYTRSRAYVGRYKSLVVLRGSGTALLLFLFLNFLLCRTEIM